MSIKKANTYAEGAVALATRVIRDIKVTYTCSAYSGS